MKINPPKPIIDENDPFASALFGRKDFAESLTSLLRNTTDNLVIFVNAPWGEGKTTFAEMWRKNLEKKEKLEVIYFDAYAADYSDDAFVAFSGEILELIDKRFKQDEAVTERREFKKTAVEVGKHLAGIAIKVGTRAALMKLIGTTDLGNLKEISTDAATDISQIGADIIEKQIDDYTKEKDALRVFKESLAKLAAAVRKEQGFPLLIIVDELDRCRPDFALGLLERIKHLFDVEGVAFVLLVNREQIESHIKTVYGSEDAREYLLKFANVFVDLPNQKPLFKSEHEKGRYDYCQILFGHYGLHKRANNQSTSAHCLSILSTHFCLTLREMEKVFAMVAIYYASLPQNTITNDFLVPMLAVIKLKKPLLYDALRRGAMTCETFFKETGLDHFKKENYEQLSQDWVRDLLCYCIMSDPEFEKATKNEDGSINTKNKMSHTCGKPRVICWWNRKCKSGGFLKMTPLLRRRINKGYKIAIL